ncbi:MAG: type I restriction-modification enzyme R subunit C-terminal domain-containing protein [Candidatus Omnitrophota bacterium]|jgi:type I restriction enzyme R subunit
MSEAEARQVIDGLLKEAGWIIQDVRKINLSAGRGVAVREFPTKSGPADYMLFVDRKAVGTVEAKAEGITLSGVAEQTARYNSSVLDNLPRVDDILPVAYESTGIETFYRNNRDPDARSRRVFAFHSPDTLADWLEQDKSLRQRLRELPPLDPYNLRQCQIEAITNLEKSLRQAKPRALLQMATGSGKTYTAISEIYRLIKFAKARRILFLVDRCSLGRQVRKEFQNYIPFDDNRNFTDLYIVQHMTTNVFDPGAKVCITTIQRLFSMLKGDQDLDASLDEKSLYESDAPTIDPQAVQFSGKIPVETFDFIIVDECHRSIYNLWRQVLEYFDSFIIGLTATPSNQTIGFFNKNLVMEYDHNRAVADKVNVGFDVYRIRTKTTEEGGKIPSGFYVDKRDRLTRKLRWEKLDEDIEYAPDQLDRSIVVKDQIRTVIREFKDKLFTEIFPGRTEVPKTLIFAKDDSHAEDITEIVREEFGKGNDFCKKITYRTQESTDDLIAAFRNSFNPRIAVTVDMISTGTDIKPLECILFMRDVKSAIYFEQMKGRGTRVIDSDDLMAVTPDAKTKTHFILVDAVGVCESEKTQSFPLDRQKSVPTPKLLNNIAIGIRDNDTLSSLASRLSRLDLELEPRDIERIKAVSGGKSLSNIVNDLVSAIDPDIALDRDKACAPLDNPELRELLTALHKKTEQTIDTVTIDTVTQSGFDQQAKDKASSIVKKFEQFIAENKDKITALQILYNLPYKKRYVTYEEIRELVEKIEIPPYGFTTDTLWRAYEQLEKSKVRPASIQKQLTDIVSLVRFAIHQEEVLEPFKEHVEHRFQEWLKNQQLLGKTFSTKQIQWLTMISEHIAGSGSVDKNDFLLPPFSASGGIIKAKEVFGDGLDEVIEELNTELVG